MPEAWLLWSVDGDEFRVVNILLYRDTKRPPDWFEGFLQTRVLLHIRVLLQIHMRLHIRGP